MLKEYFVTKMFNFWSCFTLYYRMKFLLYLYLSFSEQINEVLNGFFFDEPTVNRIANQFETEMNLALNEQYDDASLLCENTYIPELPDGTENGKFLALDLGGTNFRVILLELNNGTIENEVVKMYHIGSELRVGDEEVAVALFDHIGQCLCDFVEENDLVSVPLPLGELNLTTKIIYLYSIYCNVYSI